MQIVILGTGNLATRLGLELKRKGLSVTQIYGRNIQNAKNLAGQLGCSYTTSTDNLDLHADLFILAVTDSAIEGLLRSVKWQHQLVVHTSGSVLMDVFTPWCTNFGVLYPLQTLSKEKEIDFWSIPVCIEANNAESLHSLRVTAGKISGEVVEMNSVQRGQLHLAAVFACNFVNHFYSIGETLLKEKGLRFGLLMPLIMETAGKVKQLSPLAAQTGPAVRQNQAILTQHQALLESHPEWQKLYQLISEDIIKNHTK